METVHQLVSHMEDPQGHIPQTPASGSQETSPQRPACHGNKLPDQQGLASSSTPVGDVPMNSSRLAAHLAEALSVEAQTFTYLWLSICFNVHWCFYSLFPWDLLNWLAWKPIC